MMLRVLYDLLRVVLAGVLAAVLLGTLAFGGAAAVHTLIDLARAGWEWGG